VTKEVPHKEDMWKSGCVIHSFVTNTKFLYPQETEFGLLIPSMDFVGNSLFRLLSGHIHMTTLRWGLFPYDG
jgi:hypothetical protein